MEFPQSVDKPSNCRLSKSFQIRALLVAASLASSLPAIAESFSARLPLLYPTRQVTREPYILSRVGGVHWGYVDQAA